MTHEGPNVLAMLERLGAEDVPSLSVERQLSQKQRVIRAIEARAESVRKSVAPSVSPDSMIPEQKMELCREPLRVSVIRRLGWTIGLAAGVALAATGWTVWSARSNTSQVTALRGSEGRVQVVEGEVRVIRPGDYDTRVSREFEIAQGDFVQTESTSKAVLTLRANIRVELFSSSHIRLGDAVSMNQSDVWLRQGKARFDVAKRPPNGKFSVHSPDADITVHGTSFTVEVRQIPAGVQTIVSVTEGLVSVDGAGQTHWLKAGENWASREDTIVLSDFTSRASSGPLQAIEGSSTAVSRTRPKVVASPVAGNASTLGAESQLFAASMAAKRRGDDQGALRLIDEFLGKYPASQLAQNARVERFRVLKRLGLREQAASAARDYMAQTPDGFAREEARSLAIPAPQSPVGNP